MRISTFSARSSTIRTRARFAIRPLRSRYVCGYVYRYYTLFGPDFPSRIQRSSMTSPPSVSAGARLPGLAQPVRHEVRPRDHAGGPGDAGAPESAYPTLARGGNERQGLGRGLRGRGPSRLGSPHRPLHLPPSRARERAHHRGRPAHHGSAPSPAASRACARRRRRSSARGGSGAHPTYFEVLTAAALDHFRRRKVDVAVLEVGMGGRLDATNVADPLASAIVSIDYDHQAYLGKTLGGSRREKAGVLRRGRATVLGPMAPRRPTGDRRGAARAMGARARGRPRGASRVRERARALDVRTPRRPLPRPRPPARRPPAHEPRWWPCASWRKPGAAGLRFDLVRALPRHRGARAGRAACSGSGATRRCSWTAPTTPPARVR